MLEVNEVVILYENGPLGESASLDKMDKVRLRLLMFLLWAQRHVLG
jgi:hypothetical protein